MDWVEWENGGRKKASHATFLAKNGRFWWGFGGILRDFGEFLACFYGENMPKWVWPFPELTLAKNVS